MQTGFTLDPDGVWKGGTGNDYWNAPTKGSSTIYGWYGSDTILAGPEPDELHGQWGNDTIFGGGGYDRIFGELGNDTLHGGGASDIVNGGNGNDRVYGDAGNDILYGGKGNDIFTGGSDSDAFMFNLADFDGGKYVDHITDFHAAQADAIHLPASDAGAVHFANTATGSVLTFDHHDDTIFVDNAHVASLAGHVFYDLA